MLFPVGQQQSLTSGRFWLLLGSLILLHFSWWHCYFSAACSWDLFARATSRQAIPSTSRQACSCYKHGACSGKRPPSEDTQQTNQSQKNMHPTNASIFRESCAQHPVIIANQHRCTKLKPSALYPTRCTVSTVHNRAVSGRLFTDCYSIKNFRQKQPHKPCFFLCTQETACVLHPLKHIGPHFGHVGTGVESHRPLLGMHRREIQCCSVPVAALEGDLAISVHRYLRLKPNPMRR